MIGKKNDQIETSGQKYYDYRAELMVRNNEGLTKTYNRFHSPDETSPEIYHLRELHAAMDRAVLDAYGWTDVPTDCEFIPDFTEEDDDGNEIPKNIRYRWPDEVRDDVLARLLALNAERYAEEENAGLHAKKKTAKKKAAKKTANKKATAQPDLIGLPPMTSTGLMQLETWQEAVANFRYESPSLPRTKAQSPLAYYRILIPALVQMAGGRLPLEHLYDAAERLEDLNQLLELADKVPSKDRQIWQSTFSEAPDANAFGSALKAAVEVRQIVRLVDGDEGLELRLVKDNPVKLKWQLLDAQILLAAEATVSAAADKAKSTVPEALRTSILPFAHSA